VSSEFDPISILEMLATHGVEHVVVGGTGGIIHGSPMSTDDVDIVPDLSLSNLYALADALNEMDAELKSADAPDGVLRVEFSGPQLQRWIVEFRFLHLRTKYGDLDIIHRPGGTNGYQDLARGAETVELGTFELRVAALEDIIRSKQAVARERDLEQLPTLRMLLEEKRKSFRPGQQVLVPWEQAELEGRILEIRGFGPAAQADVRVEMPDGSQQILSFPLSSLKALS
jgi:hypothetical protein